MKKIICIILSTILIFALVGCNKDSNTDSKKKSINWSDYLLVPSANVTEVAFVKLVPDHGWSNVDDDPSQATAILIDGLCPQCNEAFALVLEFKDLPEEKLGDKTIVIKKEINCRNWSNHKEHYTGDFDAVIQLTLAE